MQYTVDNSLIVWVVTCVLGLPFGIKMFLISNKIKKEYKVDVLNNPLHMFSLIFTGKTKGIDKPVESIKSLRFAFIAWNIVMLPGMTLFIYILHMAENHG